MSSTTSTLEKVNSKFDSVVINYEPEPKLLNRLSWEDMEVETQRELLAYGKVRFFKDEAEIPFHRALL